MKGPSTSPDKAAAAEWLGLRLAALDRNPGFPSRVVRASQKFVAALHRQKHRARPGPASIYGGGKEHRRRGVLSAFECPGRHDEQLLPDARCRNLPDKYLVLRQIKGVTKVAELESRLCFSRTAAKDLRNAYPDNFTWLTAWTAERCVDMSLPAPSRASIS
jgi:hypothetical protein